MKILFALFSTVSILFLALPTHAQVEADFFGKGKAFAEASRFKEAAETFNQSIRQNPKHAASFTWLAWCQIELRQYNEAIESARAAVSLNADDYVAYNNLALALIELGRADEAVPLLKTSIKLNPIMNPKNWTRS